MTQLLKSLLNQNLLALVAFTAAVTPQALRADNALCTRQNVIMSGTYAMSGGGTIVGVGPIAMVGAVTYDGQGNGSVTYSVSANGAITRGITATGTFIVNRDCTGSKTFGSGPTAAHYDFIITPDGSKITWVETDAGVVISGQAVRLLK
jgi:hypothetical protein